jgi:hypothetical protein
VERPKNSPPIRRSVSEASIKSNQKTHRMKLEAMDSLSSPRWVRQVHKASSHPLKLLNQIQIDMMQNRKVLRCPSSTKGDIACTVMLSHKDGAQRAAAPAPAAVAGALCLLHRWRTLREARCPTTAKPHQDTSRPSCSSSRHPFRKLNEAQIDMIAEIY